MVTDGDKSLIPGGKLEFDRPIVLCGGCGTDRLVLPKGDGFIDGPWIVLPRGGGGCCWCT